MGSLMYRYLIFLISINAFADSISNYNHASSYAQSSSDSSVAISNPVNVTTNNDIPKNTPSMTAPSILPTASCLDATSGSLAISGFGISGGGTSENKECHLREMSRLFYSYNMKDDAIAVLCSSKYAKSAPSCEKFNSIPCHNDEIVAKRLGINVCK
jgi:hypothetical protein